MTNAAQAASGDVSSFVTLPRWRQRFMRALGQWVWLVAASISTLSVLYWVLVGGAPADGEVISKGPDLIHQIGLGFERTMNQGASSSMVATIVMSLWALAFRDRIRHLFIKENIRVRAPLMLGVAPLIYARADPMWAKMGTTLDIDFRYAGKDALEDLEADECEMAVVSDVALCAHLSRDALRHRRLSVMPMTMITDHIRIVCRAEQDTPPDKHIPSLKSFSDLNGLKLGYMPGTVHDHFIDTYFSAINVETVEMNTPMQCMVSLLRREVDAVVLWEPHYHILRDCAGLALMEPEKSGEYVWFLCLVATRRFLSHDKKLKSAMVYSIENASSRCRAAGQTMVVECHKYMHSDFTGLESGQLLDSGNVVGKQAFRDPQIDTVFQQRLELLAKNNGDGKLGQNIGLGAGMVLNSPWGP